MNWKIQAINTQTGKVTMEHESGHQFDLVIPAGQRGHVEANDYLRNACDAYKLPDAAASASTPKRSPQLLALLATALISGLIIYCLMRFA